MPWDALLHTAAAVADPTRLRILFLLAEGPLAVAEIAVKLEFAPSTVTYHLGKLHHAGLVTLHRRGRQHIVRRVHRRWAAIRMAFGSS